MWVSRREWDALQEKIDILREQLEHDDPPDAGELKELRKFVRAEIALKQQLTSELQLLQWKRMRDDRDPDIEAGL